MKIALAQINTTIGDFDGTVRKIAEFIDKAKKKKADLIAFPEMTMTGYPPRDLVEISGFVERNLQALEEVARLAKGIAVVVGYVGRNEKSGGKALFNAAALCVDGKVKKRYAKNLLPTYDVFDEGRYFEPGTKAGLWNVGKSNLGISICEDCWNDKLIWEKRLYQRDPIEEQVKAGAEFLLNISSSPFSIGKDSLRRDMLQALALKHGLPLFYVNLIGGNDELVFDGRSLAINDRGAVVAEGKAFEEDLVIVDPLEMRRRDGEEGKRGEEIESVFRALVLGTRDYVRKCGFQKVALGLSGGIDSSLTAVIAVEALGPENVLGVSMPSPYSSEGSVTDARLLTKNLGIRMESYPIASVYESYRHLFQREGEPDLADENVQARIRGNILMALSNRYRYLLLSTGNKSELAVGYCTLYGDMSGGLAIISDLPKTMVYEVARFAQRKKPVIPEAVFTKPPSAELRPNQKDVDSLPPYEILDPILKMAIEESKTSDQIVKKGFDRKTVEDLIRRIDRNEYKRWQAAPGIKVTAKAFGIGRRFPIARKV